MDDAEKRRSVCNDSYARRFMDDRGMQIFAPFKSETMPSISSIARCKIDEVRIPGVFRPDRHG